MAEENANLTEPMSQDIMSGTPDVGIGTENWDNIKDALIVGSEPLGTYQIEGLENATKLHNMVVQYPVFNAPTITKEPTLESARDEILGGGVEQVLSGIGGNGPNEVQPVRFGVKSSNFDRYYNHPKFNEIGFHPYADNETKYNERSTWWDENTRARSQFGKIFSTGFLSTYKAMGDLVNGDYLSGDTESAEVFADAMRIGNSSKEGAGAFFNNLMLNSGYTVGIMANIAVEELAMAGLELGTFGGATPLVASRTAYNAIRGGKAIDKMFDVGDYAGKSRSMLQQMKNLDWANDFWRKGGKWLGTALTPNTYKALKNINSVQNGASLLSNSAKLAKTSGALYRDFRAINLAMAESKLEGGMVKNDLIDELYAEFVKEHGRAPVGEELLKIVNKGDEASFTTTMLNAPVIYFSNAIVFDTMLRGFKGTGSLLAAAQKGIGGRVLKSNAKQMGTAGTKAFYDGGKTGFRRFVNKGLTGNLKTFAGAALNYGQANFVEGMQELIQEGIAVGAKDYYRNLYKDPMAAGLDAIAASTYAGAKSQMSGEGFEVFMSGFLMGGLVQGPQKLIFEKGPEWYKKKSDPEGFKEYQESKDEYIKQTVDVLNKVYENPEEYFQADKIQALTQKEVNEGLFASSFAEDAMSFMDKKDSGIFHALYTVVHAGKMGEFKSQMQDYLQLDEKGLIEAFPNATREEVKSGKTRERIEGMIERMDDIEKSYKELNDKIINPFTPKNFKKGTKEHFEETISSQAFDHAKMIAMFTRNNFERALERSNEMYKELSTNPVLSKMDANDISVLADTAQLIQEIRILKLDIKNSTTPIEGEGKINLSGEMKTILDKKKRRLELLQDYFDTLTDPENIEKYEGIKGKESKEGSKEDEEFNRLSSIITDDAIKKVRADILSTSTITDEISERLVKYQSGTSNPFGVFDINNSDKLERPVMEFLNEMAGTSKDNYIKYDEVEETIIKLIDQKALKGRADDYNKMIKTILNPKGLKTLSDKISIVFKELFFENKAQVLERMKSYVAQEEKIIFLKNLAEYGIYPDAEQAEIFLKKGEAPYEYMTEDGILTPDTNIELYEKKDEILGTYLNLSSNKVQSDKKEETKDKVEKDEEHDKYNFEDTHFDKGEDTSDISENAIGKYTGNAYGDAFLVRKHKEYLISKEGTKGEVLTGHSEWLKDPVSKNARVIESAINRIHDEIFVEERLIGKSDESFYGWLSTMKSDPRISDILRSVNIKISDIIEPEVLEDNVKTTSSDTKYKVEEKTITDKDTGDRFKTYNIVDEQGDVVNDKPFTDKSKASTEKRNIEKKRKTKDASNKPFTFAKAEHKKGDILIDGNGEKYMVFSTPEMVETNKNIYLKKFDKISSRKKADKIFLDEAAFNEMKFEKQTEQQLDYKNNSSKIKTNEPLAIFPVYNRDITNRSDQIEEGITKLQKTLREITPEAASKVTFKVTPGPNWFRAETEKAGDKTNFKASTEAIENEFIKSHGQKWQVEIQLNGETIGFFQGPTTLKLINGKGAEINPMEITESQVQNIFRSYKKDKIEDITEEVRDNYVQAYGIYDVIDKAMEGINEKVFTQKELGVTLNISEGSVSIAEPGEGVSFKDLDYNSLAFVNKEDLIDPNEKPYYILDYNRNYNQEGKPNAKVEYNVITNIKINTPSRQLLKEEARKYESKFNPKKRIGKYIALVSLPNGRSAYVNLVPKGMNEKEVTDLFDELKERSINTTDNNIKDNKVITSGYNNKFNAGFQKKLFISSNEGVYIEMKISEDGAFRVDYSDLNVKKAKKGQKQIGQDRVTLIVSAVKFQEMVDLQEVLDLINKEVFGTKSPIKGKAFVNFESFKNSVPKDPSIEDIETMSTKLNKEVKKDINFSLSSTENINVTRRRVAKTVPKEIEKEAETLTTQEKSDAIESDYQNIDLEVLENIAKKQNDNKELTALEDNIAFFNKEVLAGIRLKFSTKPVSQSNTESAAENQSAVSEIMELSEKIKLRKRNIRAENRSNPDNLDKSNREINEINKSAISTDPELLLLQAKLKVAKSKANKIIKSFDGHDIEDVETFTRWVQDNLPEGIIINIEDLTQKLKSGYITVGQFYMQMKNVSKGIMGLEGVITVGANSPFKYHEAFHSVFRMLLTEAEITKYLNLAKKEVKAKLRAEGTTLDKALDNMRKQHAMYAEMSNKQLEERYYEEYLADEFEKFKMDPKNTKTNTENKSMFQKIIDFIFGVLSEYRPRQLNKLFDGIDSGKYKNTSIKENRFTQSFDGDVAYKLELLDPKFIERKAEDKTVQVKQVKNYIPADQVNEIVSGIANLYTRRLNNTKGPTDGKILLDEAIADWIEMYNPNRPFYVDQGQWHDDNVDELTLVYESLLEQINDVKDLVERNIFEFSGTRIEDVDYTEQDEKSVGDYDKSADMFGGYAGLPKRIRFLISQTTIEETDRYGNSYVNEETKEPIIININPENVYNGLLKVLSNTPNDLKMFQKAWLFSKGNNHTKAAVTKLFKDIGILEFARSGDMFKEGAEMPSTVADSALYLSFIKGFRKYRVDNIFAHTDTDTGITHLYAANKKDDAHSTVQQWAEDFNKKYPRLKLEGSEERESAMDALSELTGLLKRSSFPETFNLTKEVSDIADILKTSAGMNIHENYILYSIYDGLTVLTEEQQALYNTYSYVDPLEVEALSHVRQSLSSGENLYLDNQTVFETEDAEGEVKYEKGGVKNRLKKIALNNSSFDESVGASTFIDSEGNRRYAHQDPTFHLEKIAEMEGAEYIDDKLKEDVFFEKNMLLKDSKFQAMVAAGQVRALRIVGSKEGPLALTESGLQSQKGRMVGDTGVSYGKSNPREFALDMIHAYLYNYNRQSPDKTRILEDAKGIEFVSAPINIRVIEASNTGDFVSAPVHKMLERSKQGNEISKKAIDMFANEVRIEFDRARKFHIEEKAGVENLIDKKERLGKLHTTYTLLTKLTTRQRNIKAELPKIDNDQKAAIADGKQTLYISTVAGAVNTNLSQDQEGVVDIDGEMFVMKYRGKYNYNELSEEEQTKLIDNYRPSITTIKSEDKKQFKVDIDGIEHFTTSAVTRKFFAGYKDMVIFDFARLEESETVEVKLTESEGTEEIKLDTLDKDITAVQRVEKVAEFGIEGVKEEDLFDTVMEEIGGKELIKERLQSEVNEFILGLKEVKAYSRVSGELTKGLGEYVKVKQGKDTAYDNSDHAYYMELYNLKENDLDFNLAQVYLNNYINTKSFNQLLLGDQALSLKNFIDAVKRAKMQNGAGASAATEIYDEGKGIMHKVDRMSAFVHEDFEYEKQFNEIYKSDRDRKKENGELTDGQIYITEKTLRYMLFGFGKLNDAQADILDDIAAGNIEKINSEFFGSNRQLSHKKQDMIANSLKIVYGDGLVYEKMSATLLSKNAYSVQDMNGNWVARVGREALHNKRVKLEAFEAAEWAEGRGTLAMSVPKSASKMMNANIMPSNLDMINTKPIDGKYSMDLSAKHMRLQMINPSNKIEIVDARQIKNLITNEQDMNATVIFDGKELTVRELIQRYHTLAGDKLKNEFFAQRNLTFTWSSAIGALDKVTAVNGFVPKGSKINADLRAFVKYAIAGLEASKAKTQMLSYFQVDEFGEPQYNLNGPMTHDKFEELFLAYFSKGILAGKQPGVSAALVSDFGVYSVKRVKQVDKSGTPIDWQVIRSDDWENLKKQNPSKYKAVEYKEDLTGHVLGVNDFYLDRLRSNVQEYDKSGKSTGQKFTEFMMAPHFKSQLDNNVPYNQALPDAVAKMFGIRIPSQDKHSAVNLRLVDYLPVYMGSSAMYARELIELSGADFDIDKLYMHMKEFYHDGRDFVEYGKTTNDIAGYEEYVRWVLENATKGSAIRQSLNRWNTNEEVKTSLALSADEYNALTFEERALARDKITNSNNKITIDLLDAVMHSHVPLDAVNINKLFDRAEGLPESLEAIGLPVTFAEYKAFKDSYKREPFNAAINNELLDVKFGLLGNKGITEPRKDRHTSIYYEPAVTSPLSDEIGKEQGGEGGVLEWLRETLGDVLGIVGENELDVDSLLGQIEAWTNNKEGARSIGNVVLPNMIISVLTEMGVKIRRKKGIAIPEMNGVKYDSFGYDYEINHDTKQSDPMRARKQFIISALITAMTDNAKLRLASKLGLKKAALANVVTMLGLGVDLKTAVLMLQFPTIKEALFHGENKDDMYDPGHISLLKTRLIAIDIALLAEQDRTKVSFKKVQVNMDNLIEGIATIKFDRSEAFVTFGLGDDKGLEIPATTLLLEKATLEQYLNFNTITETTEKMSPLINLQKGLGKDLVQFDRVQEAAVELGLTVSQKEFEDSLVPFSTRDIFLNKGTMHNVYYEVYRELHDELLPTVMLKRTPKFLELKNKVLANMRKGDDKFKKRVSGDLVSYLTIKAYMVALTKNKFAGNSRESLQNSLVYDGNIYSDVIDPNSLNIEKVINRIKDRLSAESKTNYFIDVFTRLMPAMHEDNKSGLIKLMSNTWTQFSDSELIRVQNSVLELLNMDNGDATMYDDVQHIVHYLAVMDGMAFGDGSFINVIPTALTKDLLNSVDAVQDLFMQEKERKGAYKNIFDIDFDQMIDEFIKGYSTSKANFYYTKAVYKNIDVIEKPNEIDIALGIEPSKEDAKKLEQKNKNIFANSPVFLDENTGTLTIDIFRGLPFEFNSRVKRVRFLGAKATSANYLKRDQHIKKIKKAGLSVKYIPMKIGDDKVLLPQIVFPAVIRNGKKLYMLDSVLRDKAYKTEGDLTNIIPSDSNVAYGNEAKYIEVEVKGSSVQTAIAFMFGVRPSSEAIVEFGKDKRKSFGEAIDVKEEDEQSGADVLGGLFGDTIEEGNQTDDVVGEYVEFEEIDDIADPTELTDEEKLTDWYNSLSPAQLSSLAGASNRGLNNDVARATSLGLFAITSAKDVVSLLKTTDSTADKIIDVLKKCYT